MNRIPLLDAVRACTICAGQLPDAPRPILQVHPDARLLIASQAPGRRAALTTTVRDWEALGPALWPWPHPSPRNNLWRRRNPWFEAEVLPRLRERVRQVLGGA